MNLRHLDAKHKYFLICLFAVSRNLGSVWISKENRPEYWTVQWRIYYADGEPNFSGKCLYLSKSWLVKSLHIKKGKKEKKCIKKKNQFFFRNFLWRDTGCFREKFALCEIENCVDFEDENKEVSDDAIDFEGKDIFFATFSGKVE